MGRPMTKIEALHGYKIEELIKLKNNTKSKYTRLVLTAITMRYYGYSNEDICKTTQLSKATIISYIRNWNKYGFKSLKDNRGGSIPKLDAEIIDNLVDVAISHSPTEFGFSTFTWTCELLKIYVEQNFGRKVSNETIRRILIKNKISYKRAQPKPTNADIAEQNEFKKMLEILPILESSSNTIVYALDETGVSVESDNHSSWSPVGRPPVLEKNARHEGVNIIGSTAILNRYHIVIDTYPSSTSIKSKEVKAHIEYLLDLNEGKKVVIFLDNAKFHKSLEMQKFYYDNNEDLELIFLPKYSPFMNPQEQVWHYLKANLHKPSARESKHELFYDINLILGELNLNKDKIRSLADGRKYLL